MAKVKNPIFKEGTWLFDGAHNSKYCENWCFCGKCVEGQTSETSKSVKDLKCSQLILKQSVFEGPLKFHLLLEPFLGYMVSPLAPLHSKYPWQVWHRLLLCPPFSNGFLVSPWRVLRYLVFGNDKFNSNIYYSMNLSICPNLFTIIKLTVTLGSRYFYNPHVIKKKQRLTKVTWCVKVTQLESS